MVAYGVLCLSFMLCLAWPGAVVGAVLRAPMTGAAVSLLVGLVAGGLVGWSLACPGWRASDLQLSGVMLVPPMLGLVVVLWELLTPTVFNIVFRLGSRAPTNRDVEELRTRAAGEVAERIAAGEVAVRLCNDPLSPVRIRLLGDCVIMDMGLLRADPGAFVACALFWHIARKVHAGPEPVPRPIEVALAEAAWVASAEGLPVADARRLWREIRRWNSSAFKGSRNATLDEGTRQRIRELVETRG